MYETFNKVLRVLFFPYVVQKANAHVSTKALSMHHQAKNGFRSILIGISQHEKQYLVYIPHREKIISLYDIVFGDISLVRWLTRQKYLLKVRL